MFPETSIVTRGHFRSRADEMAIFVMDARILISRKDIPMGILNHS